MSRFVSSTNEYLLEDKRIESSLYYKNITRINESGKLICNKCGQVHDWDE